jgi:hypothetical protein
MQGVRGSNPLSSTTTTPQGADGPAFSFQRWYDRDGKGGQRRRQHGRQPLPAGSCMLRTVTTAASRSRSRTPSHREVGHAADLHRPIRRHPLGHRPPATRRRQPLARDLLLNRSIRHPDRISPGQVLTLPVDTPTQPPPRRYIVRRGDTLSGIAQRELGDASRSRSLRIRAPKAHMTGRSTWQLATSAERRVGQPPARSRWR